MDHDALNWAALAVPIFLVSILIEAWIHHRRGTSAYSFGTALSDMSCGLVFQALELFFKLLTLGAYAWIYDNHSLIRWDDGHWAPWVLAFLGVDLLFYWWHRASHVVNWLWAVHGVHHQSEDMNFAVALRQPAFEPFTWFLFYAPLALLGVSPLVYLAAYGANRFYQFWIHTELVDKFSRPVEWLLNTPSHHRAHHGVNPQYLDRNYGAILILWDRLFGTFEVERERVIYGTTVPLTSYNPLWGNLALFERIGALIRGASSPGDRLWAPFAHPAWLPDGVDADPDEPKRMGNPKYRPETARATMLYVAVHFAVMGVLVVPFLLFEGRWSLVELALGAGAIIGGSVAFVGFVERKRWAWTVEVVRLALSCIAIAVIGGTAFGVIPASAVAATMAIGFGVGLWRFSVTCPLEGPARSRLDDVELDTGGA